MKIVQIEDFFHPETGYQINLLSKYFSYFGHDVTVITSDMEKIPSHLKNYFSVDNISQKDRCFEEKYKVRIIRLPIRRYLSGRSIFSAKKLLRTIKETKPDVLYVHGNDTWSAILVFLMHNLINCKIVSDSHMVDIASTNRFRNMFRSLYRFFITPIIVNNNIPVIRTADSDYIVRCFNIPVHLAPVVTFGSDTMLFHPDENQYIRFRKDNSISLDAFVVVYAGKLDASKGGLLLADLVNQKFNIDKEVVFVIIGNSTGEYGETVENRLETSTNKVLRFPTQSYENLPQFLQASDLAVIPKACSLTFYDYQACGLPVVAENNDINIARCNSGVGMVFREDDGEDFKDKVEYYASLSKEKYNTLSSLAVECILDKYDYLKKAREYEAIIRGLIDMKEKELG